MKRIGTMVMVSVLATACQDATAPRPVALPDGALTGSAARVEAGNNLYAVVNINGGLVAGNGVTSVSGGFGIYEVTFNQNVSQCAYVVTNVNAYSQALNVFAASGHNSVNGVYVETKNQGGGLTAGPFHLVVTCNNTLPYAVVGYSANLVRSSGGVSLTVLGNGVYEVTFPQSVASCAYLASVNDPGNALVFSPSGVYTASGSTTSKVYIETKNPGGGLQGGVPFHLVVVCAGAPRTGYAVVRSNGTARRGAPATGSTTRTSLGNYRITSATSIANCAKIVTRGSVDTSAPFNPATMEIGASSTATTFNVESRQLLFFGGNFFDESFHTAVVC